jgi:hypothetical protein
VSTASPTRRISPSPPTTTIFPFWGPWASIPR